MSVGIIVSCMPSLACFLRHHFPHFSVIKSLQSFKLMLIGTGRPRAVSSSSSTLPSTSFPHSRKTNLQQLPDEDDEEKGIRMVTTRMSKPKLSTQRGDTAMGMTHMTHTTAQADGNPTFGKVESGAIRVQHEWKQTISREDSPF